jgi:rhodanese-related sulfurtransferase
MFFMADGSYDVKDFLSRFHALGIDKEKPFVFVYRSANRTGMVGNFLSEKSGYRNVYHLTGGVFDRKRHGKPLRPHLQ